MHKDVLEFLENDSKNLRFSDLERVVFLLGMKEKKRSASTGDHYSYVHPTYRDLTITLSYSGNGAKAHDYEIKQLKVIITKLIKHEHTCQQKKNMLPEWLRHASFEGFKSRSFDQDCQLELIAHDGLMDRQYTISSDGKVLMVVSGELSGRTLKFRLTSGDHNPSGYFLKLFEDFDLETAAELERKNLGASVSTLASSEDLSQSPRPTQDLVNSAPSGDWAERSQRLPAPRERIR